MSRFVVDASVAIKWFIHEVNADAALRLLDPAHEIAAPDLLWPEFGNVLWKKRLRGEVSVETARGILTALRHVPIKTMPSERLIDAALDIANRVGRTVYDSVYLALAAQLACRLVTADQRLCNAVKGDAIAAHVLWVEDQP